MPGAPDDGVVLFRPTTQQRTVFYAQTALGYSFQPLRTRDITSDPGSINASGAGVIQNQFTQYFSAGFEFLDRVTLGGTFPVTWGQEGSYPNYVNSIFNGVPATSFNTAGPAVSDVRLDARVVIVRTRDRKGALGAQASLFAPSGTKTNFGGDRTTSGMLAISGEYTIKFLTIVANTGIAFRPVDSINSPSTGDGLGVGNEWRWAVGALVPIKDNKYRIGATIFGQTGTQNNPTVGNTVFSRVNTPIEWNAEGRMRFGPLSHFWAGASVGTRITEAYGAPDFRIIGLVGMYVPILDSDANSPEAKLERRARWREQAVGDADHDGIPDDIDACPNDPEDHLGNDPNDGCPLPPDRDGDGIPDMYDKCPDQPEDKDGIDDGDGCPEDDADHDGIPDTVDACPKEPGQASPDPKKNGCPQFIKMDSGVVRVLQQVHFAYNSATILPDSFPMLQEIANLLKANANIKRMAIEGHTDDRGPADYNQTLSQARASSVMNWLLSHGVEHGRLEAHGYGKTKPIADNATDTGRTANRRVEFKILEETDSNKVQKPQKNQEVP
jgi:OOP family OmpA-OmpF porin